MKLCCKCFDYLEEGQVKEIEKGDKRKHVCLRCLERMKKE